MVALDVGDVGLGGDGDRRVFDFEVVADAELGIDAFAFVVVVGAEEVWGEERLVGAEEVGIVERAAGEDFGGIEVVAVGEDVAVVTDGE